MSWVINYKVVQTFENCWFLSLSLVMLTKDGAARAGI